MPSAFSFRDNDPDAKFSTLPIVLALRRAARSFSGIVGADFSEGLIIKIARPRGSVGSTSGD